MDIIFREIREFGVSLILLDQHPSKISLYAIGNTYCTICMNLKHKTDINAVAQCLLLDKEKDILGSLEVGQAVVKIQGRIAHPFQVSIPEFVIKKGRITDTYVKKHMQDIVRIYPQEDFRLNWQNSNEPQEKRPDIEITFLKDVVNHPDIGIAERYRHLGISVRQGQKIKAKLLEEDLIEEHRQTTETGRLIVICLTEKGRQIL